MERFDDYWGTPAKVSKVTYQIYEDSTALMMALKGGSVDIWRPPDQRTDRSAGRRLHRCRGHHESGAGGVSQQRQSTL